MSGSPHVRSPHAWLRAGLLPLLALLVLLGSLVPRAALASRPVIVPGREGEVEALLAPYTFDDELTPGWTLRSFEIETSTINVRLGGPDEVTAQVALDHPDYYPEGARQLEGFALTIVDQPPGSEAAVAELVATIERNDDGSFWREETYADQTRAQPEPSRTLAARLGAWSSDGLVLLGLFTLVLLGLVVYEARDAEPWMNWTLAAIVLAGAALRAGISPVAPLAPWSYTRLLPLAKLIYEGPLLTLIHPERVWLSELNIATSFVLSLLAPLAVYVHARRLLDDPRAALVVAGLLAFLPLHLRFSHTDAAFIPSITISSLVFTLVHVATRETKTWLAWLALALIGPPLALTYLVRPLNIIYFPLLLATVFVDGGIYSDKPRPSWPRVAIAAVVISAVTALGIHWLLFSYTDRINEGLDIHTLLSAIRILFSPRMNTLLNPIFTAPGLMVLAVLGAFDLRRRGKTRLLLFLLGWLATFFVCHAYYVPMSMYMQARYHLHLVVPFLLLAACGVEASLAWLAEQRAIHPWLAGRRYHGAIAALVAYVLASPLIHLHAIRYVAFNEVHEWRFVHSLRETVPAQCTIVEYVGIGADSRFDWVGSYVEAGVPQTMWTVVEVPLVGGSAALEHDEAVLTEQLRTVLDAPPECLYWFEGLPCFGMKPERLPRAPVCKAIEGFVSLEQVAATTFDSVPYDENLANGLLDTEQIELRLFRVRSPDE